MASDFRPVTLSSPGVTSSRQNSHRASRHHQLIFKTKAMMQDGSQLCSKTPIIGGENIILFTLYAVIKKRSGDWVSPFRPVLIRLSW